MSRDREVSCVALDTLATAIEEIDAASLGLSMLPLSGTNDTLEERAERRTAIATRLGETRVALVAQRGIIERQKETTST